MFCWKHPLFSSTPPFGGFLRGVSPRFFWQTCTYGIDTGPVYPYYFPPFIATVMNGENCVMKTFSAKPAEVKRDWYIIDATGKTLGRLAAEIAKRLRGKHKPEYTPHVDTGDYIVVINAEKVHATGNKMTDKFYHHHTGYPGGIKSVQLKDQLIKHPTRVIEHAVKGMMPKNPLGRAMFRKLKVYAGTEHKHTAQQPKPLDL